MRFAQLAAVIASLIFVITSSTVFAETEVDADFQDAVVQDSVIDVTKTINKKKTEGSQGGIIILNTNSNDNQNDSAAEAYSESDSDVDAEIIAAADTEVVTESFSQADSMRNARKSAEVSTEQRIVEKLEASRLEDERRRADTLFGDRFEALENKKSEKKKSKHHEDDYGYDDEIIEKKVIVKTVVKEVEPETQKPEPVHYAPVHHHAVAIHDPYSDSKGQTYMGVTLGGMSYDASNVESKYAAGILIGKDLNNKFSVEGSFLYSNHFVDTFWKTAVYSEVSQYDFGFNTKYSIFTGKLRPYVGVGATYTYRNYQDRVMSTSGQSLYYNQGYSQYTGEANTHAVDGNLMAGIDVEISKGFLLGAEYKHSMNVFVNNNEPVFAQKWAQPQFGTPLEEIDRSQVTVNAKYLF